MHVVRMIWLSNLQCVVAGNVLAAAARWRAVAHEASEWRAHSIATSSA